MDFFFEDCLRVQLIDLFAVSAAAAVSCLPAAAGRGGAADGALASARGLEHQRQKGFSVCVVFPGSIWPCDDPSLNVSGAPRETCK